MGDEVNGIYQLKGGTYEDQFLMVFANPFYLFFFIANFRFNDRQEIRSISFSSLFLTGRLFLFAM